MFKSFDRYMLEKARYAIAPDGMLAAEAVSWRILSDPLDALLGVGGGDLLKGMGFLRSKVANVKRPWHNFMMLAAKETVGAAATFTIRFKIWQPMLVTTIDYSNDTTDTGALTSIKVNGELLTPRGITSEDTSGTYDITNTFADDDLDIILILPPGSEIEFNGTATNGDVVQITLKGYDLDMERI